MADDSQSNPAVQAQKDLHEVQSAWGETYKALNQIQPSPAASPEPPNLLQGVDTTGLRNLLNQPMMQKYVKLVSTPQFTNDVIACMNNPHRVQVAYWELGWIVFIFFLRMWRMSRSKSWLTSIWIQLSSLCLFWVGAIFVIPDFFFVEPYTRICSSIIHAIMQ